MKRDGFTLVELLITIMVIGIMASMVLFAMFSAQESARAHKTKALIAKLDAIIKAKYEAYQTRRLAFNRPIPPTNGANQYARDVYQLRLDGLRELMRMELPDRWSDIADPPALMPYPASMPGPAFQVQQSSTARRMHSRWMTGAPSNEFAGAECLYMIVMLAEQDDGDDKSLIKQDSVGDADGDGFPEFWDAWQQPIRFLRWAPGFTSDLQQLLYEKAVVVSSGGGAATIDVTGPRVSSDPATYIGGAVYAEDPDPKRYGIKAPAQCGTITGYSYTPFSPPSTPPKGTFTIDTTGFTLSPAPNDRVFVMPPDPSDPNRLYRPSAALSSAPFALFPLIYSAGPNKCYGITSDYAPTLHYSAANSNPFYNLSGRAMIGTPDDLPNEPNFVPSGWQDNIHNHTITAR